MPDTIPPTTHADASDDADVDLEFERWAMVSAQLLRRLVTERAQVLRDSGVGGDWFELDQRCFGVLAGDIERGRLDRVERYARLCAAELARRPAHALPPGPAAVAAARAEGPPLDAGSQPPPKSPQAPKGGTGTAPPSPQREPSSRPPPSSTPPLGHIAAGDDEPSLVDDDVLVVIDDAAEEAIEWPVEKYAWLCAELAEDPERAADVWSSHGLEEEARAVVRDAWDKRLERDGRLREQHRTLVERFRKMLGARPA
jgi:hypothetical protein